MARSTGQKRKLLYILDILKKYTDEDHPISTKELIDQLDHCGVSAERKSIYGDIEELNQYGYDIISIPSRNGGGYYLASRDFELPELKLLVDAVAASRFIPEGKSSSLIKKLEGMVSSFDAGKLQRSVVVAGRAKTDNDRIFYSIDGIHDAIQNNQKIQFEYLEWNEKKTLVPRDDKLRVVSPWTLVFKDENYYLLAYDSEASMVKHYRVDKMAMVTILEEKREGREAFEEINLANYVNQSFGMFGGNPQIVTIRFPKKLIGVIIDRFGKDVTLRPDDTDREYMLVRTNIHVSGQFYGWLCGLGPNIKIVDPQDVVEGYKNWIKNLLL